MEFVGWRISDLDLIPDLLNLRSGFYGFYQVSRSSVAVRVGSSRGIWDSLG